MHYSCARDGVYVPGSRGMVAPEEPIFEKDSYGMVISTALLTCTESVLFQRPDYIISNGNVTRYCLIWKPFGAFFTMLMVITLCFATSYAVPSCNINMPELISLGPTPTPRGHEWADTAYICMLIIHIDKLPSKLRRGSVTPNSTHVRFSIATPVFAQHKTAWY